MYSNTMVRCPHCQALVHLHPTDREQFCVSCHKLFDNTKQPTLPQRKETRRDCPCQCEYCVCERPD
jgi:hypothetical protein